MIVLRRSTAVLVAVLAGCAHVNDSQIIAVAEKPKTLAYVDTVDTARLAGDNAAPDAAARALAELVAAHMATVGIVRAPVGADRVVVELPAPGWLLRARLDLKPELFCLLTLEPIYEGDHVERQVLTAPWSVHDAFDRVHGGVILLRPPAVPPIPAERFARLRNEATAAATANRDPPLTQVEYRRTPRPISEQPERPYYTPPQDSSGLREAP